MSVAGAHKRRLKALHRIRHVRQGEPDTVKLLRHSTVTGGLEVFLIISEGWTKSRLSNGIGGFIDGFEIAEDLLTPAQAQEVHALRYNDREYRIDVKVAPEGLNRYWFLQIRPVENL
jgi:hypothetical protein